MTTYVPPEGSINAEIAIVGEAPGVREEIKGRPFVGPAGQLLDKLLAQAGILRSQCYLTNVMKVRPPRNEFQHFWLDSKQTKTTEQLEKGIEELQEELSSMPNLKVIICLGRQPIYCLLRLDGISKLRGSVYDYPEIKGVKVISTFHPSFCLRQWDVATLVVHDFKVAKAWARGEVKLKEKKLIPYPTDYQIINFMEEHRESKYSKPLSVDIECTSQMISRISLANEVEYSISIPFLNIETNEVLPARSWIWTELAELLYKSKVVGQNFTFDMFWLFWKQGIEVPNFLHDTMIAQHVILPGLPSFLKPLSLAMLTSLYTNEPFYKDEGKVLEGRKPSDFSYGIYSARDAAVTLEVYQEQIQNPTFQKQREVFEFEMELVRRPIKQMMREGILVDVKKKEEMKNRAEKELELLELLVADECQQWINLRSPKQVAELLFDELGLKGGVSRSTNEDALKILQAKYPEFDTLNYILQHRGIEQVHKNILSAVVDSDRRMRCSYSPTTDTGRFKSSKNPFGTGTNLQNVPRDKNIRGMFLPDPGYYLIEYDLEQAELRLVAYLANETHLIGLLEREGLDIHTEMAQAILQKGEISFDERQLGKRIVHAGNYRISKRGLVRACRIELGLDISEGQADKLLSNYFKRFPMILAWHRQIESDLRKFNRTLKTPLGRERTFYSRWGNELFRAATAFLPQSTIADLLNKIMLKWLDIKTVGDLRLQLHDAFYPQIPKDKIEVGLAELKEAFNYPFEINGRKVVIPAAFKVSERWGGEKICIP